jgi:hypothetical protein
VFTAFGAGRREARAGPGPGRGGVVERDGVEVGLADLLAAVADRAHRRGTDQVREAADHPAGPLRFSEPSPPSVSCPVSLMLMREHIL